MTQTSDYTAPCPYAVECGGCKHQDLPYDQQLDLKQQTLRELFKESWDQPIPIDPSPRIWNYRNKVEFNFDLKMYDEPPAEGFQRETIIGFKKRGKWYWTLDLEHCFIAPEDCGGLLGSLRTWLQEQGLRAQHRKQPGGALRYLVVRASHRTDQRMVILLTSPAQDIDHDAFVQAVIRAYPADSIYHGIYHGKADAAYADELVHLHGAKTITETLHIPTGGEPRKLDFVISPFAFFQVNPPATELLYGHLRQWVQELAPAHVYDLYGGSGGIAFSVCDLVPAVTSVEEVEAATSDGQINAERNTITNVDFVTADVRRFLQAHRDDPVNWTAESTVIVDPPRAGMHPKVVSHLLTLLPANLLYVSCNPGLLARELPRLTTHYELQELRAVDLFPHTPHVECLARLVRRKRDPANDK